MIICRPKREKKPKSTAGAARSRGFPGWPKARVDCSGQGNVGRVMVDELS